MRRRRRHGPSTGTGRYLVRRTFPTATAAPTASCTMATSSKSDGHLGKPGPRLILLRGIVDGFATSAHRGSPRRSTGARLGQCGLGRLINRGEKLQTGEYIARLLALTTGRPLLVITNTRHLLLRSLLGPIAFVGGGPTTGRSARCRCGRCTALALLPLLLRRMMQLMKLTQAQILHVAIFVFASAVLAAHGARSDSHDLALEPAMSIEVLLERKSHGSDGNALVIGDGPRPFASASSLTATGSIALALIRIR